MVQLWTYTYEGAARRFLTTWLLARTTREDSATLTPTLSLSEGEGGVLVPSHPERAAVRAEPLGGEARAE
jgi:hypothetical protein